MRLVSLIKNMQLLRSLKKWMRGGKTLPSAAEDPTNAAATTTIVKELNFAGFKRELSFRDLPVESSSPSSLAFAPSEPDSKPQFGGSLLRSAAKLRVFVFGHKKRKCLPAKFNDVSPAPMEASCKQRKNFNKFQVGEVPIMSCFPHENNSNFNKFQVEEVPIVSRFSNEDSSRSSDGSQSLSPIKTDGEEKKSTGFGVSKVQKPRFGNILARLRARPLRKNRSASLSVTTVRSPLSLRQQDNSLLEQQEKIQSAIDYCKCSFNASN